MIARYLIIAVCAALFIPVQAGAATDPSITARRAAQMLDRAATALAEAEGARDRVKALTGIVQAYEEGLLALREGLRQATIRERALLTRLQGKQDRVARLLGALQVIQRSPAPLLLLHPTGPVGTARSAMMLSDVTPALQAEAETLRAELEELRVLRLLQESAAGTLTHGLNGAQEARVALSQAIADRVSLPRRFDADPNQMRALIESSDTLDGFAEGLSQLDVGVPDQPVDFATAQGRLPLPAAGAVVLHGFNEADAAGVRRPGLVLAVPDRALVTAPWPATVRYAGPLLDYGNVIVFEPGSGYLLVVAGLADLFVSMGEVVPQGAAVGLVGGEALAAQEFATRVKEGSGVTRRETLYIELRDEAAPVDPADWFLRAKD